uniref:Uncharacterized protein n=1 Tax=Anguilla anguilla TaxID=7936 RepID=A0A0E9X0I1_ANGAN
MLLRKKKTASYSYSQRTTVLNVRGGVEASTPKTRNLKGTRITFCVKKKTKMDVYMEYKINNSKVGENIKQKPR